MASRRCWRGRGPRAAGFGLVVGGLLVGACGDDGGPAPAMCPVGDRSQPIELRAMYTDGVDIFDLTDGAMIPLRRPLQGGQALMVGVRATNVDGCRVSLTSTIRDPDDDRSLGLDIRPVLLEPRADGWAWPAEPFFQSVGSTPACPNNAGDADIHGNRWKLELRLEEEGGRSATVFANVMPFCDDVSPKADCECECDSDYELGDICGLADAGVDAPALSAHPERSASEASAESKGR